jgi:hypothetical protein
MRFQTLNPSFRPNIVYTYHIYIYIIHNKYEYICIYNRCFGCIYTNLPIQEGLVIFILWQVRWLHNDYHCVVCSYIPCVSMCDINIVLFYHLVSYHSHYEPYGPFLQL